jgi:hypothetical protein
MPAQYLRSDRTWWFQVGPSTTVRNRNLALNSEAGPCAIVRPGRTSYRVPRHDPPAGAKEMRTTLYFRQLSPTNRIQELQLVSRCARQRLVWV